MLYAKEGVYLHELSFLIGNSENGSSSNLDRSLAYQLQYQYNGLTFPVRPELSLVYSRDIPFDNYPGNTRYFTAMANGVYAIPYTSDLTPYVKAGVGYTDFSNEPGAPTSSPILDTGAGLKLHLNNSFSLKLQALYTQGKDNSNILVTGGLRVSVMPSAILRLKRCLSRHKSLPYRKRVGRVPSPKKSPKRCRFKRQQPSEAPQKCLRLLSSSSRSQQRV